MATKKITPQYLMEISFENRQLVISKLSLYQLDICYRYFKQAILDTSQLITDYYHDYKKLPGDFYIVKDEYLNCMEKVKKYEQLIYIIENELEIRNINKRFFNK